MPSIPTRFTKIFKTEQHLFLLLKWENFIQKDSQKGTSVKIYSTLVSIH
jgi:hypothetical protein